MKRSEKIPIINDPLAPALAGLGKIFGLTPEFISLSPHVDQSPVTELTSVKVLPPAQQT
jgi:hypothetical protein